MDEVTPVPIPNTAVKLVKAEDSNGTPIVKIGVCHILYSSLAQLVERPAVNRQVVGSSPTRGAKNNRFRVICCFFYARVFLLFSRKLSSDERMKIFDFHLSCAREGMLPSFCIKVNLYFCLRLVRMF